MRLELSMRCWQRTQEGRAVLTAAAGSFGSGHGYGLVVGSPHGVLPCILRTVACHCLSTPHFLQVAGF
jgi:hypothetical protein